MLTKFNYRPQNITIRRIHFFNCILFCSLLRQKLWTQGILGLVHRQGCLRSEKHRKLFDEKFQKPQKLFDEKFKNHKNFSMKSFKYHKNFTMKSFKNHKNFSMKSFKNHKNISMDMTESSARQSLPLNPQEYETHGVINFKPKQTGRNNTRLEIVHNTHLRD